MASRDGAADSHQLSSLKSQNSNTAISADPSITSADQEPPASSDPSSIVRRRRPEPINSPVKAMSLVGLKNLFFRQALSPDWSKTNQHQGMAGTSPGFPDWNSSSNQPLLQNDSSSLRSSNTEVADIESQDFKAEKASKKKGFTIDARVIGDATLGLSDGLTVPFALTAGLSALGNTKVVIYGGFAELIAGAISMGLGGYLSAKGEADAYQAQRDETEELIATNPQSVAADIADVFEPYNLPKHTVEDLTQHLTASPHLTDFIMQFQHCAIEPAASRAATSAITIALAYFMGGLLPLMPYLCVGENQVFEGLYISIGVMVVALFVFGYVKTCIVTGSWWEGRNIRAGCWGGTQMVVVGSCCAGAAMGLVKLFNQEGGSV